MPPFRAYEPATFDVAHNSVLGELNLSHKDAPKVGELVAKAREPASETAVLPINYLPKEVLNWGVRPVDLADSSGSKTLSRPVAAVSCGSAIAERSIFFPEKARKITK